MDPITKKLLEAAKERKNERLSRQKLCETNGNIRTGSPTVKEIARSFDKIISENSNITDISDDKFISRIDKNDETSDNLSFKIESKENVEKSERTEELIRVTRERAIAWGADPDSYKPNMAENIGLSNSETGSSGTIASSMCDLEFHLDTSFTSGSTIQSNPSIIYPDKNDSQPQNSLTIECAQISVEKGKIHGKRRISDVQPAEEIKKQKSNNEPSNIVKFLSESDDQNTFNVETGSRKIDPINKSPIKSGNEKLPCPVLDGRETIKIDNILKSPHNVIIRENHRIKSSPMNSRYLSWCGAEKDSLLTPQLLVEGGSSDAGRNSLCVTNSSSGVNCFLHSLDARLNALKDCRKIVEESQNIIHQTSLALNTVYYDTKSDRCNLPETIECERILMLAYEKKCAAVEKEESLNLLDIPCSCPDFVISNNRIYDVSISDVGIQIRPEYFNNSITEIGLFHFFITLSFDKSQISSSNSVSILSVDRGTLNFPGLFSFVDVPQNTPLKIKLFGLNSKHPADNISDDKSYSKRLKKSFRLPGFDLTSPIKSIKKLSNSTFSDSNITSNYRKSSFNLVSQTELIISGKSSVAHLQLSKIPSFYPISGHLNASITVQEKRTNYAQGFLTIFQHRDTIPSWERFWCKLSKGELLLFEHPEDDDFKSPVFVMPLIWADSEKYTELVPYHICPRPYTFEIKLKKNPLSSVPDSLPSFNLRISADSKADRDMWISAFNLHSKSSRPS